MRARKRLGNPYKDVIEAVVKIVEAELKQILRKDINKRVCETYAFVLYDNWWQGEEVRWGSLFSFLLFLPIFYYFSYFYSRYFYYFSCFYSRHSTTFPTTFEISHSSHKERMENEAKVIANDNRISRAPTIVVPDKQTVEASTFLSTSPPPAGGRAAPNPQT